MVTENQADYQDATTVLGQAVANENNPADGSMASKATITHAAYLAPLKI